MTRAILGSHKRQPFSELFFSKDFTVPLSEDNTFAEPLEMLRLAPSSTNSQPWRCLVKGNSVLFYYKKKSKLSVLDCGIGMCHFMETEKYRGHSGEFVKETDCPEAPKGLKYLRTYHRIK